MEESFTYPNVYQKALEYLQGDELAATTWMQKYAVKNKNGDFVENSPEMMHQRMAREFARIEKKYNNENNEHSIKNLSEYGKNRKPLDYDEILHLLKDFKKLIPQGSVMAALGNPYRPISLSNCVVLPKIYDSYAGILETDERLAQLFKRRCGVGIDISSLRPKGAAVSNAAITSSGAVSFMERFSNTTREVAQAGRRGALMITLDIRHPDTMDFIQIKQDLKKVTGANISLKISDAFMKAVENNEKWLFRWPLEGDKPLVSSEIDAKEVWKTIVQCAHKTAEPGILFWDKQHSYSTSSVYPGFENLSTNPCSEIAMQGGDSCRLMALNLFGFVKNPFTTEAEFQFEEFYRATYESQRLMDDLVDLEIEHIDEILEKIENDNQPDSLKRVERQIWQRLKEEGKKGRRTGLGFTALADCLAALGLKYGSDRALEVTKEIMKQKCAGEFDSSIDMAIERGSFTGWDPNTDKKSDFIKMLTAEFPGIGKRMQMHGRRNISISTVAPTGTLSLLSRTSSGIEPVFRLEYTRRRKSSSKNTEKEAFIDELGDVWEEFTVQHPGYTIWQEKNPGKDMNQSPYHKATSETLHWKNRLAMQQMVQKYTTHSISSTVNLPAETKTEEVEQIYMQAWKMGLKGVTIYRDGSRSGVLVSSSEQNNLKSRPIELPARILQFKNNSENWIAVVGFYQNRPYEIFTGKLQDAVSLKDVHKGKVVKIKDPSGKSRYDLHYVLNGKESVLKSLSATFNPEYWNYAILISGILRAGMQTQKVVDLIGRLKLYDENINTWKSGVRRALQKCIEDGTTPTDTTCPSCKHENGLVYKEGCLLCQNCGYCECG